MRDSDLYRGAEEAFAGDVLHDQERYWYAYRRRPIWQGGYEYYRFTDAKMRERWIAADPYLRAKERECYVPNRILHSESVWVPFTATTKRGLPIEGERWSET